MYVSFILMVGANLHTYKFVLYSESEFLIPTPHGGNKWPEPLSQTLEYRFFQMLLFLAGNLK